MQFKQFVAALAVPALAAAAAIPQDPQDIVGGTAAEAGDFPFIASIQLWDFHFCGGILLNADTVVTAAHCIIEGFYDGTSGPINVRVGSLSKSSGGVVAPVSEFNIHPNYKSTALDWDIAVLKLGTPVPESSTVSYATLPAAGSDPVAGSQATAAGWGALGEGNAAFPDLLQKVTVPIVSRDDCNEAYGGNITQNMICAGVPAGGKDSCQGDSGGPIVDASSTFIGIVSWGQGCARPNYPGVYSHVGALVDFIDDHA